MRSIPRSPLDKEDRVRYMWSQIHGISIGEVSYQRYIDIRAFLTSHRSRTEEYTTYAHEDGSREGVRSFFEDGDDMSRHE